MKILEQYLNQLEQEKAQPFRNFYEESDAFRFVVDMITESAGNKDDLDWFKSILSSAKRSRELESEGLSCGT